MSYLDVCAAHQGLGARLSNRSVAWLPQRKTLANQKILMADPPSDKGRKSLAAWMPPLSGHAVLAAVVLHLLQRPYDDAVEEESRIANKHEQ